MTLQRPPEEEALDRVILELRSQPALELDWRRIEARLEQEQKQRPAPRRAPWISRFGWPAGGLLTAAAVAALTLGKPPSLPVVTPAKPIAKLSIGPVDGDRLARGTHLSAASESVHVEHRGRAAWTLEPHASAALAEAGEFLTVRLESGALSATVVPNPKPETFAVEVGGTRVAVHGTAFRVERVGDRVLVSVSEGTVAVEPTGTHSMPAFLLRRDSRGSFALDGRTGNVEGNASVVSASSAQSHRDVAPPFAAHASATGHVVQPHGAGAAHDAETRAPKPTSLELPQQPSISDTESGVSAALQLMNHCFQEKTRSNGIGVSARTALTLSVSGGGTVDSVTFAPPLAPAVEDCAVNGLRGLAFPRSVDGVTFTRIFELSR